MMLRPNERQAVGQFKVRRLNLGNLHYFLSANQDFAGFELRGSKGSTNAVRKFKAPRKSSTESDSVFPKTPASIRLKTMLPTSSEAAKPQYSRTVMTIGPNSFRASCRKPSSNSPASTWEPASLFPRLFPLIVNSSASFRKM